MNQSLNLLPVSMVARALGTSEGTVRRLARAGTLTCVRLPSGMRLFDPADVRRVAQERRSVA